jgi:hypothetical protein
MIFDNETRVEADPRSGSCGRKLEAGAASPLVVIPETREAESSGIY